MGKPPRPTKCAPCHVGEAHEEYPGFPAGVYVSDVNPPYDIFEVKIDSLKEEAVPATRSRSPIAVGCSRRSSTTATPCRVCCGAKSKSSPVAGQPARGAAR